MNPPKTSFSGPWGQLINRSVPGVGVGCVGDWFDRLGGVKREYGVDNRGEGEGDEI